MQITVIKALNCRCGSSQVLLKFREGIKKCIMHHMPLVHGMAIAIEAEMKVVQRWIHCHQARNLGWYRLWKILDIAIKNLTNKLDVFQYTRYSVPSAAIDHVPSFTRDFDSQPSPFQTRHLHPWLHQCPKWTTFLIHWPLFLSVSVQSFSCVQLFGTPWTAACQASLSITNSRSLPKLMSIESVMPSNHLILCRPLLLLPSVFPSIRVFPNESVLLIRWPKYWSFSFSISPSNERSGLISFRMDWLDLLAVQGTLKSLLQHHYSFIFVNSPLPWQHSVLCHYQKLLHIWHLILLFPTLSIDTHFSSSFILLLLLHLYSDGTKTSIGPLSLLSFLCSLDPMVYNVHILIGIFPSLKHNFIFIPPGKNSTSGSINRFAFSTSIPRLLGKQILQYTENFMIPS